MLHGGGVSYLGALPAVEYMAQFYHTVLARLNLKITITIADGMGTREYPNIKSEWSKDLYCFFFTGFFYQMMAKAGPIRKQILAKLTGRSVEEADQLLYQKAT